MKEGQEPRVRYPAIVLEPHGAHRFTVHIGHVEMPDVAHADAKMKRKHIAEILNELPRLIGEIDQEAL